MITSHWGGGEISGNLTLKQYLQIKAWEGYGSGISQLWFDGNKKELQWQGVEKIKIGANTIIHSGNINDYAGRWVYQGTYDLNEIRDGFRAGKIFGASNAANDDASYRGFLEYGVGGYVAQFNSDSANNLYYRWCEDGNWKPWKTIAFTDSTVNNSSNLGGISASDYALKKDYLAISGGTMTGHTYIYNDLTIGLQSKTATTQTYLRLWKGDGEIRHRAMLHAGDGFTSLSYYCPDNGNYRELRLDGGSVKVGNGSHSYDVIHSGNIDEQSVNHSQTSSSVPWGGITNAPVLLKQFKCSIPANKGVRITYIEHSMNIVFAYTTFGNARLMLMGSGYGSQLGGARNNWVELVSSGYQTWNIPVDSEIKNSIEIMGGYSGSSVKVYSTDDIIFEEIDALTTPSVDRQLLSAGNYNSYALPLSGGTIKGNIGALKVLRSNQYACAITFQNTKNGAVQDLGGLGFDDAGNASTFSADYSKSYTLIHSGNIGSQNVQRAKTLETLSQNGQAWYGDDYKLYGQWTTNDICDWKVDGYKVRVSIAKTLDTTRKIWGQDFNGSADVNGVLTADERIYSPYVFLGKDAEGIYLAKNVLAWHNANNTWTKTIIDFSEAKCTIEQPTRVASAFSVDETSEFRKSILANRYNGLGNVAGAAVVINKGGDFFGIGPSSSNVSVLSMGLTSDSTGTWKSELITISDGGVLSLCNTLKISNDHGIAWSSGDTYNCDSFPNEFKIGTDRSNTSSLATEAVKYCTIFNAAGSGFDGYRFQMASYAGGGNRLFYRGYNGNNMTWDKWVEIIHTGNSAHTHSAYLGTGATAADSNKLGGLDSGSYGKYLNNVSNLNIDNNINGFNGGKLYGVNGTFPIDGANYGPFMSFGHSGYEVQISSRSHRTFFRTKEDGTFSAWREFGVARYIETKSTAGTWYGDSYKAYLQWDNSNYLWLKTEGYSTKVDAATKATQDGNGNTITSTYLTTGGTAVDSNKLGGVAASSYMRTSGGTFTGGVTGTSFSATTSISAKDGFFQTSDETLKDFYDEIDVDFDKLKKIPKRYYKWKSNPNGDLEIGTSAQKVQDVYPELVGKGEKLSVDYSKLSVVALKAIDLLKEENEQLKDKVSTLEDELRTIKKILGL